MTIATWLETFLSDRGATSGTVHLLQGGALELAASVNVSAERRAGAATISKGRGLAGLAWELGEVVAACDAEAAEGAQPPPHEFAAIAIPVWSGQLDFRAVVGLTWNADRDFSEDELAEFERAAAALPQLG